LTLANRDKNWYSVAALIGELAGKVYWRHRDWFIPVATKFFIGLEALEEMEGLFFDPEFDDQ